MGGWTGALLGVYLLGVLTLPLLVVAVFAHAHLTFPYIEDEQAAPAIPDNAPGSIVQPGDDVTLLDDARKAQKDEQPRPRPNNDSDVAAGYFAVCREYMPMGINAKPIERATPVGSATVASPSPSVYQTMYRSIFDRKQASGPLDSNGNNQRPKNAGNVFYVVLR